MKLNGFTLTAALMFAGAAFAQADMTAIDLDGDGLASYDEMIETYTFLDTDRFIAIDTDEDEMISEDELAAAEAAGLLEEPAD